MKALYYGDNLQVLRDSIANESVDLIYLDPPFNSKATCNVGYRGKAVVIVCVAEPLFVARSGRILPAVKDRVMLIAIFVLLFSK